MEYLIGLVVGILLYKWIVSEKAEEEYSSQTTIEELEERLEVAQDSIEEAHSDISDLREELQSLREVVASMEDIGLDTHPLNDFTSVSTTPAAVVPSNVEADPFPKS